MLALGVKLMLMCKYKFYENNVLQKTTNKPQKRAYDEIVDQKIGKLIIKIKELKIVNPDAEVDEVLDQIYRDLDNYKNNVYIRREFKIKNCVFAYKISRYTQRFHIYKSIDDKTFVSIRDYYNE